MKNRSGTTFLVLALLLGLGAAERALGESHVVSLSLHPSTALEIILNAQLTSHTRPYDLEFADFEATIEIESDPTFGLVATSIRFDSGRTYFTETGYQVMGTIMGLPINSFISIVDPFARLTPVDLPAVPFGPNTSSFSASALDYTIYDGYWSASVDVAPGMINVINFEDSNMVVPLSGSGSVELIPNASALGAQVIVTLPLDGLALSPWSEWEFAGDLVLTSEALPPSPPEVLPLAPLVGWVSVLVLATIGRRDLRGR